MKKKILSIISALVIICSLIPAGAVLTGAAEGANETAGKATLTIIHGVDWNGNATVVVNKTYPFEDGATLADLFEVAKAAGDIADYAFSGGYISSVTPSEGSAISNADDFSYYWANYKNGRYASGYTDCTETDKLTDGIAFQFAYQLSSTNIAPDWNSITVDSEISSVIAGGGEVIGTSTLKIVQGVGWDGKLNNSVTKQYSFSEGATLVDLFEAAKKAGDISDYAYGDNNYINSITFKGGASFTNKYEGASGSYWANYQKGTYVDNNMDGTINAVLTDGSSFEFSWEDYSNMTGLDSDEWTDLSAKATAGSETAKGPEKESESEAESKPEDESEPESVTEPETTKEAEKEYAGSYNASAAAAELADKNEQTFAALYEGLKTHTKGSSDWYAMCAAAIGETASADKAAAITDALESYNKPSGSNLQSSIIILSALGVDVTKIDDGNGGTINLLEKLSTTKSAIGGWAESLAYTLLAYGANPSYGVPADAANSPSAIIAALKNSYLCSDGGFGWGGTSSPDTTGAVIAALSCYPDNADAKAMMNGAVKALKALQNSDGGFGYAAGAETNVDSTALAIIGLTAAGVDPTGADWTTASGSNPITALLSFANEKGDGLTLPKGTYVAYAESDAFRALVAYSGFRNSKSAYNVYTMAAKGGAAYKAPEPATVSYTIVLIENQNDKKAADWTIGSTKGLLIRSDAPFGKFEAVLVDGAVLAASNYQASEGSTNILLKADYLNTLKAGKHKVTIKSTDGEASAEITIKAAAAEKSPKTGDNAGMFIMIALIAVTLGSGYMITRAGKSEQ